MLDTFIFFTSSGSSLSFLLRLRAEKEGGGVVRSSVVEGDMGVRGEDKLEERGEDKLDEGVPLVVPLSGAGFSWGC